MLYDFGYGVKIMASSVKEICYELRDLGCVEKQKKQHVLFYHPKVKDTVFTVPLGTRMGDRYLYGLRMGIKNLRRELINVQLKEAMNVCRL
jgi:hypothetical protein